LRIGLTVVFVVKDTLESVGHLLLAFRIVDDDGDRHEFERLQGFAEESRARW